MTPAEENVLFVISKRYKELGELKRKLEESAKQQKHDFVKHYAEMIRDTASEMEEWAKVLTGENEILSAK